MQLPVVGAGGGGAVDPVLGVEPFGNGTTGEPAPPANGMMQTSPEMHFFAPWSQTSPSSPGLGGAALMSAFAESASESPFDAHATTANAATMVDPMRMSL
jgi:hypothetical protein